MYIRINVRVINSIVGSSACALIDMCVRVSKLSLRYIPRFICANPNLTMAWIFAVRCLLLTACALGDHFRGAVFMVRPSPGGAENEVSGG